MKIVVTGTRFKKFIGTTLDELTKGVKPGDVHLIVGGADGADDIAAAYGDNRGWRVEPVLADWNRYRRAAGMIRNHTMCDMIDPDEPHVVVSFNLGSPGTTGCVEYALKSGLRVVQHGHKVERA